MEEDGEHNERRLELGRNLLVLSLGARMYLFLQTKYGYIVNPNGYHHGPLSGFMPKIVPCS